MTSAAAFGARPEGSEIHPDLKDVALRIHEEFGDRIDPRDLDECLVRVAAKFDGAKVRSFVPLLVRRYVRDELNDRLGETELESLWPHLRP